MRSLALRFATLQTPYQDPAEVHRRDRQSVPGVERLPVKVQEALPKLVYDCGAGFGVPGKLSWDKRHGMRTIRDVVAKPRPTPSVIAGQFRVMKWLWWARASTDDSRAGR